MAATMEQLRAREDAHWELAFMIDGIQPIFVSHANLEILEILAEHGLEGRTVRSGLVRDGLTRRFAVDVRSGRLLPQQMQVNIEDNLGDLPALFATDDASVEPLEQNIGPGDDLSALTQFHDKWIGHEKIGPAGERRRYPVPFGFNIGLDHFTISDLNDDSQNPMHPPPVSDVPVTWKGRRCMLYRVYRDHIGDPSLEDGLIFHPNLQTLVDPVSGLVGTNSGSVYAARYRARDFSGAATHSVTYANVADLSASPMTVSAWVYTNALGSVQYAMVIGPGDNHHLLRIGGGGQLLFVVDTDATSMTAQTGAGAITAGVWQHVTITWDGSLTAANVTFYVNNTVVAHSGDTNGTGTADADSGSWYVGAQSSSNFGLDGYLTDLRVYDRELSAAEVQALYEAPLDGWLPPDQWERIWWGVLEDDGTVEGRVWTVECAGPESWLQKDLGQLYQTREASVSFEVSYVKNTTSPAAELDEHESGIAIRILTSNEGANGGFGGGGTGDYGNLQWSQGYQFEGDTISELRDELGAAIVQSNNDPGSSGDAWNDIEGCSLIYSSEDRTITFTLGEDVAERAHCIIAMHRKLWGLLGFDIGVEQPDGTYSREGFERWEANTVHNEPPGDGYVFYQFVLLPNGVFTGDGTVNKPGGAATLEPDYKGGVVSLDPTKVTTDGLVMLLNLGDTNVAHYGQLWGPVASDPNDHDAAWPLGGTAIDRSGLLLLTGKRRFANSDEEIDTYQIVAGSWGDSDGLIRAGRVVITKLMNPYNFGYDNAKLSTAWNAQPGQIKARPFLYLGYRGGASFDEAHVVMQRIMLTTGTSTGWSSYSLDDPILDAGDNESVHDGNVVRDAEYADLGLGIPAEMLQHWSAWSEEAEAAGDARKCVAAITPGQNAEDLLHGLMRPVGWAWSLRNGRYGIFTPFASIKEEEITAAITRADVDRGRARDMVIPKQSIRTFAPIDEFVVNCSWAPYDDAYLFNRPRKSNDRGRRYRPGGIQETIDAPAWRGLDGGLHAEPLFVRLQEKARFWERRHFVVEGLPVLPTTGRLLWPGQFVRFSHDLPVDPIAGTYGVSGRRAAVFGVTEGLDRDRAGFRIDLLVHADRTSTPKLHGFSARGIGWDSDNDRILVADNWLGLAGDGTRLDSAFFVEPSYVGLVAFGGNARIQWAQWDGNSWEFTGTGVVTSVGTDAGSCYLEMSAGVATGTYHPCKETIVMSVDITAQDAAWVLQLYAGIGDEDGEYSMGNLTAIWEDVS